MNYIFAIICSIILSPFSAIQIKQKLCIDCKFFTKPFFTSNEFGKCVLFPRVVENDNFLVNGINTPTNKESHYCSIVRRHDDMCGKEGKFYEKKKRFYEEEDK